MAQLRLKKERLAELSTTDLHLVAGGVQETKGLLCLGTLNGCQSVEMCTTAMSCGCPLTWNCH